MQKGVLNGYSPNLIEQGRMTVASLLKGQGYATGCIGKWHLGLGTQEKVDYSQPLRPNPTSHGFDYYFGISASLVPQSKRNGGSFSTRNSRRSIF